jgi:predicted transposase/invertase (TIGR01784 family)
MKKLLRSKANFDILEGFLGELLRENLSILEILESESNKEDQRDKFNRVDLKVKNRKNEIMIIEIKDSFNAKGIKKAKTELDILKLPEQERIAYEWAHRRSGASG